jgi:hypothetical protein
MGQLVKEIQARNCTATNLPYNIFHHTIKLIILKHIIKFSFNLIINSPLTSYYRKKNYTDHCKDLKVVKIQYLP